MPPVPDPAKTIYVISDLHLGGAPEPSPRGFRICTQEQHLANFITAITQSADAAVELVINGDSVDFLAERSIDSPHRWKPFHFPEAHAVELLDRIVARSSVVFNALKAFVRAGRRLVILPGNHDVELNLPAVRARLRHHLTPAGPADYEFITHGEAYRVGDVLIEHGNRIDDMNFVDQNELRILCGHLSRGETAPGKLAFHPPPGSKLVAELINDIKQTYSFIDLLKPEKEAAFPVLLALEPGRRGDLLRVAEALAESKARRTIQRAVHKTNIGAAPARNALEQSLLRTVKRANFAVYDDSGAKKLVSTRSKLRGFASLLFGERDETWEQRQMDLLDAIRAFHEQNAFDPAVETDVIYSDEAKRLAKGTIRHVVFGHTHLAKNVALPGGCFYFNSGTWADLLPLPSAILDKTREYAPLAELEQLMKNLVSQNYKDYQLFHPTYVRFQQHESGRSLSHELCNYKWESPV